MRVGNQPNFNPELLALGEFLYIQFTIGGGDDWHISRSIYNPNHAVVLCGRIAVEGETIAVVIGNDGGQPKSIAVCDECDGLMELDYA